MEVEIIKCTNTCTVVELTADSGAMLEAAIFLKLESFLLFFGPGHNLCHKVLLKVFHLFFIYISKIKLFKIWEVEKGCCDQILKLQFFYWMPYC